MQLAAVSKTLAANKVVDQKSRNNYFFRGDGGREYAFPVVLQRDLH
jgi:hypothetical protein